MNYILLGQTAPRQPRPDEDLIVQKEEIQEIEDDEENNHHPEVIIAGL